MEVDAVGQPQLDRRDPQHKRLGERLGEFYTEGFGNTYRVLAGS